MAHLNYTTIEELEDKFLGEIGTARRDEFESAVASEIRAYHIGEAIKEARKRKNMTQEDLGMLMGIKKAQISRIENGHSFNISTIARAFKALGLHANLEVEGGLKVALW